MKKLLIAFLSVILLVIVYQYFINVPFTADSSKPCPFEDPKVIAKQQYAETSLTRVLLNYRPLAEGHTLILPKRHVSRLEELTPEESQDIFTTVKKVQNVFKKVYGADDYVLIVQNGANAGQTVFHVHFHMIPRKEYSALEKLELWYTFLINPATPWRHLSDEQLRVETQRLSEAYN
jgi:diadenosine tetraphosphate (Ap4A) HIT family hydrolase